MIVRELFALIGFQTDEASAKRAEEAIEALKGAALGVSAAVAGIGAIAARSVLELAEFAGAAKDASEALAVDVVTLQEYDHAAKLAGGSTNAMRTALLLLGSAASGVTEKGKAARELLASVGVRSLDSAGKARPAAAIFDDLVVKLNAIPDAGKRAAIASKVLGDAGRDLLPVFAKGPAVFAQLREEAHALGAVLDADVIDQGDELGDNFDRVTVVLNGLSRTLGAALSPAVNKIVLGVIAWRKENEAFLRVGIRAAAQDLVTVMGALFRVGNEVVSMGVNITNSMGGVRGVLLSVALGFAILNAAMLPTLLMFAAVAAVLALVAIIVEDVAVFEAYGDEAETLTGRLKKLFFDEDIKHDDSWIVVMLKIIAQAAGAASSSVRALAQAASGLVDYASTITGAADVGVAERVSAAALRGRILSMRQSGASDAGIASALNLPLDQVRRDGSITTPPITPFMTPADAAAFAATPIVIPPVPIQVPRSTSTDARTIGPFYITTSEPKETADAVVAEVVRAGNTVMTAE